MINCTRYKMFFTYARKFFANDNNPKMFFNKGHIDHVVIKTCCALPYCCSI